MEDTEVVATSSLRAADQSPVLRAKLRPPNPPAHLVDRQRLYDRLDELVTDPLTVVVAPAGFGKSVLLASWATRSQVCWSWLSPDDSDRDGSRFWADMIEAIEAFPGVSCDAARGATMPPGAPTAIAIELLNDLDRIPAPSVRWVLVIDDVHVVDGDDELMRSLAVFLRHVPSVVSR